MSGLSDAPIQSSSWRSYFHMGLFWLVVLVVGAAVFFFSGLEALLEAWKLPEYSHGPLIPILSAFLFLRQLKEYPVTEGHIKDRWIGVGVICLSLLFALAGNLARIPDIVAYGLIIWTGGILLISFGWKTGKHFWPPVLHLVYMLPLPGVIYYKLSTNLQFISSELGVYFLKLLSVPVFLDGNIIDLGVYKLHVAEACSGLRYLFPILSFSYIFAVLYRGPTWHKAVLLISAAPITVLMNSVRIAVAGFIVNSYGVEWVDGFTHFFEGWIIFVTCIIILFLLARLLVVFHPDKPGLLNALDLNTDGLMPQAARIRFIQPSKALITATLITVFAAIAWESAPPRGTSEISRDQFAFFPRQFGDWTQRGPAEPLPRNVERVLKADDYHQVDFVRETDGSQIGLFMAWYADQSKGGVHSPEICLPGAGWEIAWLERVDIQERLGFDTPFNINRAIIQKGEVRMMVYYWFEQKGRRVAWDFAAKMYLVADGITTGRTDGALVRLTTPILPDETDDAAASRLDELLVSIMEPMERFIPAD